MTNFASVEDMELVLQQQIVGDEKIAAAEFALLTVTAAIRNYTHQYIELVENEEITLDSGGLDILFLPELPVVGVVSVVENGETLVVSDNYVLNRLGMLKRVGPRWFIGYQSIVVVYSHGFAVIPDIIRAVCARAASRLYQAGLRAAETAGVLGVVSKSLGDFAVTYGGESVTEGTMGASGARVLLLSEKDLLDEYRVPPGSAHVIVNAGS